MLEHTWSLYNDADYNRSLLQSVQNLAEHGGIDMLHIAGLSMVKLRRLHEGVALLNAAVTLRPQSSHIYINAAHATEQAGLHEAAGYFADLGLRDFPDEPDLMLHKANSLVMQMRFEEAHAYYQTLLQLDPNHIQSMINIGNICRANDEFANAQQWFDRAATIDPDYRDLYFARATMYSQMGQSKRALAVLEPIADDIDAQFLLALLYLGQSDYERGFRMYRMRSHAAWAPDRGPPLRPFDHWTEARGKTIAVLQEGGLGDVLQFIRYIPQLADITNSITLFVPEALMRLLAYLPVQFRTTFEEYDSQDYDYTISLIDMPYHFRTTFQTVPAPIPYIPVPASAIAARRLPATQLKRVGLCWAGGTRDNLNMRSYDTRRSFDLETLAPLGEVPGIEFVSLQLGQRQEQSYAALPVTKVLESSFDLLDTAAVIMQLDLVISCDTSIVHLAAAIGKPTWLLSRYDCCWRWHQNSPTSPWYPQVLRVFGQQEYRDWTHPIAAAKQALELWASPE